MKKSENTGISFFEKYLTVWVILCMITGVLIGRFLPKIPAFLGRFEYANVSIPIAILIWLMIYPMMLKVDFQSIKNVGKNPKYTAVLKKCTIWSNSSDFSVSFITLPQPEAKIEL